MISIHDSYFCSYIYRSARYITPASFFSFFFQSSFTRLLHSFHRFSCEKKIFGEIRANGPSCELSIASLIEKYDRKLLGIPSRTTERRERRVYNNIDWRYIFLLLLLLLQTITTPPTHLAFLILTPPTPRPRPKTITTTTIIYHG